MDAAYRMLGQRIVEAARLAVAVHLHSSLDSIETTRRQVVIGGADRTVDGDDQTDSSFHDDLIMDDAPPAAPDRLPESAPSAEGGAT